MNNNLVQLGKDEKWLQEKLRELNVEKREILIATIDGKEEIYCQKKAGK